MSLALDESTRAVTFTVVGEPSPQAGTKTVPIVTKGGRKIFRKITEGGVGLAPWRQAVADKAAEIAADHGCLTGPLKLDVLFRFPMPKSRGKQAQLLRSLPKTGAPDWDKLARAVGDSLKSGGLIADDALIVWALIRKVEVWQAWTGATITVAPCPWFGVEP